MIVKTNEWFLYQINICLHLVTIYVELFKQILKFSIFFQYINYFLNIIYLLIA